jgi:hypothetical protein
MRSSHAAPALLLLLVACSSSVRTYSAPAPENALACALDRATALGYSPAEGGLAAGFVRVERKINYSAADLGKEVATRYMTLGLKGDNRTEYDRLTFTRAGNTLRIQASGVKENGDAGSSTDSGKVHAEEILATCGNS